MVQQNDDRLPQSHFLLLKFLLLKVLFVEKLLLQFWPKFNKAAQNFVVEELVENVAFGFPLKTPKIQMLKLLKKCCFGFTRKPSNFVVEMAQIR
jgi:hypothetical protein